MPNSPRQKIYTPRGPPHPNPPTFNPHRCPYPNLPTLNPQTPAQTPHPPTPYFHPEPTPRTPLQWGCWGDGELRGRRAYTIINSKLVGIPPECYLHLNLVGECNKSAIWYIPPSHFAPESGGELHIWVIVGVCIPPRIFRIKNSTLRNPERRKMSCSNIKFLSLTLEVSTFLGIQNSTT